MFCKRIIIKILATFITVILSSCQFGTQLYLKRADKVSSKLNVYSKQIFDEFRVNTFRYPVTEIKNHDLRKELKRLSVTEISINYKDDNHSSNINYGLTFLVDSNITLNWMRGFSDEYKFTNSGFGEPSVLYSMYYFFGKEKPKHITNNRTGLKKIKINDSIWLQKQVLVPTAAY